MELWRRLASRRGIGIVGGLIVLGVVVIAIWLFDRRVVASHDPNTHGRAVPVTAAEAIRQNIPDIISTIGTVQSIDQVAVRSQVSGPIVQIEFKPGQEVKKGQELFLIDPRPFVAALDQAKAQLAHDQAVLSEAQLDAARHQTLAKRKLDRQTASARSSVRGPMASHWPSISTGSG